MSNTINTHGGARPGAGRKPHAVKYHNPIHQAQDYCAARLPQTLAILESLADGTAQSVQERWVAAGTLTTGKGANERPAYPHLPPEQLVLVSRITNTPKPDTRAATYLADRVMGRPLTNDEALVDERLEGEFQLFIQKINARFSPELARTIFQAIAEPLDPQIPIDGPLPEDKLWPSYTPETMDPDQTEEENSEAEDTPLPETTAAQLQSQNALLEENLLSQDPTSAEIPRQPLSSTPPNPLFPAETASSAEPSASPRLCGHSPCFDPQKTQQNSTFQDPHEADERRPNEISPPIPKFTPTD